jgi:hypothetical protein
MPESRKKVHELKCAPEVPEGWAFLCDIKRKLTETGVCGALVSSLLDVAAAESTAMNLLSNIPQTSDIILDVSVLYDNFKHDLIATILRAVDIDVPVCSNHHDRECLTVNVRAYPKKRPWHLTGELVYVDAEGNYIIVCT